LRGLDPATRKEKLTLLQKLDTRERPQLGILVVNVFGGSPQDIHIPVGFTEGYLSVVMAPPERLRMALRTGSIDTADEERREKEEWSHDIYLIRDIDANSVTARAREAFWHHRAEAEEVVDAVKPHIEQLLEAGHRVAPQNTGQLQLGYWIDGISAALAKLNRWDEARYWLELFFGLDPHYQDRLPAGDKEKMLKRLARCKARLAE
jgi:hypothetical protein